MEVNISQWTPAAWIVTIKATASLNWSGQNIIRVESVFLAYNVTRMDISALVTKNSMS